MDFQQSSDFWMDQAIDWDSYFDFDAGATAPTTGLADFSGAGPGEVGHLAFDKWANASHAEDYFSRDGSLDSAIQPLLFSDVDLLEYFMGQTVAQSSSFPPASVPQQNGPMLSTEPDVSLSLNGAESSQVSLQNRNSRIVDPEFSVSSNPERRFPSGKIETEQPSPSGSPDPGAQQKSTTHASAECSCIRCLSVGSVMRSLVAFSDERPVLLNCRYSRCSRGFSRFDYFSLHVHERSHFKAVDASGVRKYHCDVERCNFSTKRWADLPRHCTTKHCTNPNIEKFPCPAFGCNYGGANGFTRKDKLKSHYDNVHKGIVMPGKAPRALKPKPAAGA